MSQVIAEINMDVTAEDVGLDLKTGTRCVLIYELDDNDPEQVLLVSLEDGTFIYLPKDLLDIL